MESLVGWSYVFAKAVSVGNFRLIDLAISKGWMKRGIHFDLDSGIKAAVRSGRLDVIEHLAAVIPRQIDYETYYRFEWEVVMIEACKVGNLDILKFAMAKLSSNVRYHLKKGLKAAAENGHPEVITLLESKGSLDGDAYDDAMLAAAQFGHSDVLSFGG